MAHEHLPDAAAQPLPAHGFEGGDAGVDLDLDISQPMPLESFAPLSQGLPPELPSLDLEPSPRPAPGLEQGLAFDTTLDLPHIDTLGMSEAAAPQAFAAAPAPAMDLGSISLDLDALDGPEGPVHDTVHEGLDALQEPALASTDPMARKLDLAEEFRQIGDADGARELLQEVVEQASDEGLRGKAQSMLDNLG